MNLNAFPRKMQRRKLLLTSRTASTCNTWTLIGNKLKPGHRKDLGVEEKN
jgi:hypothetical protein